MNAHVSAITLGVRDFDRAKQFYSEGLGWPIQQEYGEWISFKVGDGSSAVGLLGWDALAADGGFTPADGATPADGGGFRGITLSYLVRSDDRVAEVLAEAERAGATIVKLAEQAQWGGCTGHFADPDGHLWKVASGTGDQPYAE